MDRSVETAVPEVAGVADADAVSRPPSASAPPGSGEGAAGSAAPGRHPGGTVTSTRPRVPDLSQSVLEAQRGDPDAFRELYRDIQPRLLRYLSALVGHDAEDVASETWLHVARDIQGFQGNSDGFRGWVATIARHRATDHLRRHGRRPQVIPVPVEALSHLAGRDDTAARALDTVSTDAAITLIASLPPDQAEAVLLRVVIGLDAESAGQVLGKRAGAVRTAAYRGIRKLGEYLDQASDEGDDGAPGIPLGGPPPPPGRRRGQQRE
jgi:RNA polymerase sigma-70 factor, ECF subfamily